MGVPNPLDEKSRHELVEEARKLGVERPERMTRVELRDEIVRRSVSEERQAEARGLFGVARSMLASVVDRGLHLPDAAKAIRGQSSFEVPLASQTPVATVTLAEIYAAQGHKQRALRMLEDVLKQEPGHEEALRVQAQLRAGTGISEQERREAPTREERREALTVDAPRVAPDPLQPLAPDLAATTEYVPGGFVETVGEEIETGQQPEVEDIEPEAEGLQPDVEELQPEAEDLQPEADDLPSQLNEQPPHVEEPPPPGEDLTPGVEELPSESQKEAPPAGGERIPALVLAQTDDGLAFYWELPDRTLDECSIDRNDGRAVVRIVSFSPHGKAPERREDTIVLGETIPVEAPPGCRAGKLKLGRYGAPAAVRAALGWESEDGFLPLTVGRGLGAWRADESVRDLVIRATFALF